MLYNIKSSSKKVLLIIAFMATALVGKVFAQGSEYSAFFKKQYSSTTQVANDLAKGKLALVNNMDTLKFINMQLSNWNTQLAVQRVKKDDGSIFQLQSNFNFMGYARPYFCDVLRNHCKDIQLAWNEGDFLISRLHKKTNEVGQFLRKNYSNEIVAALVTKSFSEISDADGDIGKPDVYGFSLACGNELKPKKKVEKVPETLVAVKEEKYSGGILSPGHEVTYNPIVDKTFTTTASAGGNTYNTYNTVNNPAPVVVKDNKNGQMLLMVGMTVVGQVLSTGLQMWSMNQQYKMSQRQFSNYQMVQNYPIHQFFNTPTVNTPIQGNTGAVEYYPIQGNTGGTVMYNPVQGATGGTVNYNPVQGVTNGTVGYNPIQGITNQQWVNDPIQGWVFR